MFAQGERPLEERPPFYAVSSLLLNPAKVVENSGARGCGAFSIETMYFDKAPTGPIEGHQTPVA